MRRDLDLIRELLLKLEEMPTDNHTVSYEPTDQSLAIPSYTEEAIGYHIRQIIMAGYIDIIDTTSFSSRSFMFRGLTPSGHDFADSVRDPEIWKQTKAGALSAGGWTLDLIKDLAKGFVKKQVSKLTGIDL